MSRALDFTLWFEVKQNPITIRKGIGYYDINEKNKLKHKNGFIFYDVIKCNLNEMLFMFLLIKSFDKI